MQRFAHYRLAMATLLLSMGAAIWVYGSTTPADAATGTGTRVSAVPATWTDVTNWTAGWSEPWGVALTPAGGFVVSDKGTDRVTVVRSDGSSFALRSAFRDPTGVAVDRSGRIYVADSGNGIIRVFSSSGAFLRRIGSPGTSRGKLRSPGGVAVGKDYSVYVADTGNNRVQRFSSTGHYLSLIGGGAGSGAHQFRQPRSVAVDSRGRVVVADTGNRRVQRFSSVSNRSSVRTLATIGYTAGPLVGPYGVACDVTGNVYVTDRSGARLQKYSALGTLVESWDGRPAGDTALAGPVGVAVNATGERVVVADPSQGKVRTGSMPLFESDDDVSGARKVTSWPASGEFGGPQDPCDVFTFTVPANAEFTIRSSAGQIAILREGASSVAVDLSDPYAYGWKFAASSRTRTVVASVRAFGGAQGAYTLQRDIKAKTKAGLSSPTSRSGVVAYGKSVSIAGYAKSLAPGVAAPPEVELLFNTGAKGSTALPSVRVPVSGGRFAYNFRPKQNTWVRVRVPDSDGYVAFGPSPRVDFSKDAPVLRVRPRITLTSGASKSRYNPPVVRKGQTITFKGTIQPAHSVGDIAVTFRTALSTAPTQRTPVPGRVVSVGANDTGYWEAKRVFGKPGLYLIQLDHQLSDCGLHAVTTVGPYYVRVK
ncbi:MAG: NHL repeat-containing protein [Coriobacteriia bacterium]|nr:NHL repeat-containing protein [Coriobacteriia bacterium]